VADEQLAELLGGKWLREVEALPHRAAELGWESGIGTTGQYLRQDLIPGNMDDGFHHRDDEAVLGVRATRVSGWEAK
jgi:hypothetical protein